MSEAHRDRHDVSGVETVVPGIDRMAVAFSWPLQTVNSYLITSGRDAVIVDTAFNSRHRPDHFAPLLAYAGVRTQDITRIVLTHLHRDHSGGIAAIQQATGAPVSYHAAERFTLAEAERRSREDGELAQWLRRHGVPATDAEEMQIAIRWAPPDTIENPVLVQDGDELSIGSQRWLVVHTPGHTPGHICLFEPAARMLVTGDHVLPNETSNISARPGQPYDPLGSYLHGLERVAALQSALALPGHGNPFRDLPNFVERQLAHHAVRLDDVRQSVRGGSKTSFDVAQAIPWVQRAMRFADLDDRDRFLAFGETVAHLECLESRGEIRQISDYPVKWRMGGIADLGTGD